MKAPLVPFLVMNGLALVGCDRPTQPSSTASSAAAVVPSTRESAEPSTAASVAVPAPSVAPSAEAPGSDVVTFDSETRGAPSASFEAIVGDWYVAAEGGAQGFEVDGSRWKNGVPSANLADQAKRLYGERYAEFLDGVKAFAFFPLAVAKAEPPPGDLSISVRFFPIGGTIDQAAGIAFGIEPNGTYLGVRANALENNVLYFRVVRGKRTVMQDVRNVPTPSKAWHTLTVDLQGAHLVATLDGEKRLDRAIEHAPAGKVGLWSKADSRVLFDDFRVRRLGQEH